MVLQRWDPIREIRRMEDVMDRMWRGFGTTSDGAGVEGWTVPVDVIEEGDTLTVKASLPGVPPEDISVTIEDGVLTLKAQTKDESERQENGYLLRERRSGSFHRAIRLPDSVDPDQASSYYEHGVLAISVPKSESKKAKHLNVEVREGKALSASKN